MYMFRLNRDFTGARAFLEGMFPKRSKAFYFRVDFFLTAVVGSVIGFVLLRPTDPVQAISAGGSWLSAFQLVMTPRGSKGSGGETPQSADQP
jgi:hypothetical protein